MNPFITGSSHTQLSKSSTIGRKLVRSRQKWNIQLLRLIILKLVMNLARPCCLRAICCWVCSYLWAHRSWCAFTMPPHQEEGDRRGFTRQGRENEMKNQTIRWRWWSSVGEIFKNPANRPLKLYGENWIMTSTAEVKNTETAAAQWAKEQNGKWAKKLCILLRAWQQFQDTIPQLMSGNSTAATQPAFGKPHYAIFFFFFCHLMK